MSEIFAGEVEVLRLDIADLIESRSKFMSPECVLLVLKQLTLHYEAMVAVELGTAYAKQIAERSALKGTQDETQPTSDV